LVAVTLWLRSYQARSADHDDSVPPFVLRFRPGTDYCINSFCFMAATDNPAGQTINITFNVAKVASNSANQPINSDPNPFYGQTASFLVHLNTTYSYYCLYFGFNLTVPDNTRAGIFINVDSSFLWGTTAACDGGEVDGYPLPGISIADTFQTRFQNQTEVSVRD